MQNLSDVFIHINKIYADLINPNQFKEQIWRSLISPIHKQKRLGRT